MNPDPTLIYRLTASFERRDRTTAYESFFEDMVIDTPEAAANLNELVESGVTWKHSGSVIHYVSADSELIRRLVEKYNPKE